MLYQDYTMEGPYTCTKYDSDGNSYETDCWRIIGSGLINIRPITDAEIIHHNIEGGGSVNAIENLGDGKYEITYTTGPQPAVNKITVAAEATVTVPEVFVGAGGIAQIAGYETSELPLRTVTLKTGQYPLFLSGNKELVDVPDYQYIVHTAYGVDVNLEVNPKGWGHILLRGLGSHLA